MTPDTRWIPLLKIFFGYTALLTLALLAAIAMGKMKKKGTLGSFGKATPKKIKAAKAEGGAEEKKAVFAQNMKKIAEKKKG